MKLSTEQTRKLMDLGWQAAKLVQFTGERILSFGSYNQGRLDPQMINLWSRALYSAAYHLEEKAKELGYVDEPESVEEGT